jgi:predicted MFS family arabinose efflux permease
MSRNFWLLFSGRAVSYFGTYLAPIAVAFAILDLGGSATQVGLSFAAWTLAQVATLAVGGVVGDRLPRRIVMIGSDTCSTAVRVAMGVLLIAGHAHIWELVALQGVGGASVAFYNPAFYGLVREIVPAEAMQRANSFLAIARYAAFPLGAAAGGTIVALIGSGTALVFDGGTYAASALLLAFVRVDSLAAAGAGFVSQLREGWSAFIEHRWIPVTTAWIALYFLMTYAPFFVLGPVISKHSMHGAGSWGAIVTGEGVGALLGSLAGLRVRLRRPLTSVCWLLSLAAVQNVLLAFHPSVWLLSPAALLVGFAFALGAVVWDSTIQRTVAPDKIARVGAYGWMSSMVFLPAGYALAGPVSSLIGLRAELVLAAAWIVASTVVVVQVPSIRDFRAEEPERAVGEVDAAGAVDLA